MNTLFTNNNMRKKIKLACLFISISFQFVFAQRGKDLPLTVSTIDRIVNEYAVLTADANAGNTSISVDNNNLNTNSRFASALAQGDLIMIVQVQGASVFGNFFVDGAGVSFGLPKDSSWGEILNYNNCGNYELAEVFAVAGSNTIQLNCALQNNYTAAGKVQIVRMPRYASLTVNNASSITCDAWNGTKGGIVAIEVDGATIVNGSIAATGRGFRGGVVDNQSSFGSNDVASTSSTLGGEKGEGIAGYQNDYNVIGGRYCKGAPANGGGGGNMHNGGGGGGANGGNPLNWIAVGNPSLATANWANAWNLEWPGLANATSSGGGKGGYTASINNQNALNIGPNVGSWGGDNRNKQGGYGGRPLNYTANKIFFGGGGGAGDGNDGYTGAGGAAGGIVFLKCYSGVSGSGTIASNGNNGVNSFGSAPANGIAGNDGAGGGGAGGTIFIQTNSTISGINLIANGGEGGDQILTKGFLVFPPISEAQGPGGGGGGGYINTTVAATSTVNGGIHGVTNSPSLSEFPPNGATTGGVGTVLNNLSSFDLSVTDVAVCAGNTAVLTATIIGTLPAGASVTWYDAPFGGTVLGTGNTFTTPVINSNTSYYVGLCPSTFRKIINVTTSPGVTASNAGINQQVCQNSATLAANIPTIGTGIWTVISGAGSIANPNLFNSTVSNLSLGSNVFEWTISAPGCLPSQSQVTITLVAAPTADAGLNQQLCANNAVLAANGSGTWSIAAGSGNFSSVTNPNATVTNLSVGLNTLIWTVTSPGCPSVQDFVDIIVSAPVSIAVAGANQQICSASTNLNATIPTVGTGSWALISGTGTITNASANNTAVSGLSLGNNIFEWTVSAPGCPSSQAQVTITVVAVPTANAGVNQQLCNDNTSFTATGAGTWSILAGTGSISNTNNPTATVSNLTVGLNSFIWTVTAPGCPAAQDTVDIVVSAAVSIADAGNNQQLCSDSTNLNALAPIVGNGAWTLITGSGSFVDVNSNASAVNGLSLGVNVFEWTVSAPGCPSTTDQVTITVDAILPIANAGIDQTLCATTTLLTANTAPAGATGTWSVISGSPSFNNINNNNTAVSNLSIGVNTLIWTIQNPLCPAVTDTVLITVANALSIADAGANQQICSSSTNLNAVVPTIGIGTWTVVSGSAVIADPSLNNSLVTGLGAGTTVLEWTISGTGCPSNASQISITVNLLNDIANAGTDIAICGNTSNLNANVASAGITGTWSSPQSGIAFLNVNDQNTAVNNLQNGANTLIWTFTNSVGCPPSSDTIIINSVNNPSQANAGTDKTICADNASLSATAPAIGSGLWSIFSGTGNITNASSPNTSVNNLLPGNIILVWTVANAPCTANSDTVTITVFAALSPAIAGADASLCDTQYNMNATAPTSGTGTWTLISGNGTISNINAANTSISNLGVGINTFQWTVANGICPDLTDQISITVAEPGSIAAAGGDIQTCTQNTQLNATTPLIGNGVWTVTQGNASISNPSNPNTNVTILSPGGATFSWQVTSGSCPASSDDLNVVLLNGSDAANAGEDVTIAIGDSTTLNGSGGTINGWDPPRGLSCIDCPNPIANPDTTTMYYLSVTDINGCTSIDSVLITVDETIGWYLPNAFSPDDNGVNDVLYFYGTSVKEFILQVFDRWGEKVFETTDFKVGWDGSHKGKPALAGVYTYQLTITFKSTVVEQVKGNLNLIRN